MQHFILHGIVYVRAPYQAAARAFFFLGSAPNEGLFAIAFEIAGPATGPTLRVNPVSGMIPGIMGKLFDFPALEAAPPAAATDR